MSEQRLRAIYTALLTVSLWHCIPAMAQETQPAKPAPPIHLRTGRQASMPVTVENKCPQQESFSVTTDGLPGNLVRAPQPIAIDANSSAPSHLIVDTRNVDPGLYSGQIVIACVTCGTECVQDREVFPLQFQIDKEQSATAPNGGQGTLKLEDESMLVIDEPAPSEPGKGQQPGGSAPQQNPTTPGTQPGTKPNGNALQENTGPPGTQPGQTLAESNAPTSAGKPPGGVGPTAPHGSGYPHAPPEKKPETGESTQPPGGNGLNAPRGGDNPPPPPPPGTEPDEGLPLPKIPPRGTPHSATAPCPCLQICAAAAATEQKAQDLLSEYLTAAALRDQTQATLNNLQDWIRQDKQTYQQDQDTGRYDDAARLLTELMDKLLPEADNLQKQLEGLINRATTAQKAYQAAAIDAAEARLKCDECVDQHPECPQSIRAPGDTTENPPPTNPPGPSTTSGGGGTNPPPTQEKPKQPPGTTPGDNPDIPKPPDLHTPGGGGYGHEQTAQCPELHHGCIALVAYLLKNDPMTKADQQQKKVLEAAVKSGTAKAWQKEWLRNETPVDFVNELKNAGCKVFAPDPELDLQPITFNATETVADRDRIASHNDDELGRLKKAVTDFRAAVVADTPEVAIVLVDAHGGSAIAKYLNGSTVDRCGEWSPGYFMGLRVKNEDILYRADFHNGNYTAVNKNVCSWFNIDLSCYGGLTPKVTDELDNYATSSCQKASAIDCPLHAGWGADGAFSSATAVTSCSYGIAYNNANRLRQLIDDHAASTSAAGGGATDFQWLIDGLKKIERGGTAYYSDRGYKKDPPTPVHSHFGYPPTTKIPPPCTGGKCGK
jgi:hypothetical protein